MIQPHPNAPEGSVKALATYDPASFSSNDAILCRNVAPLVSFAFSLIQRDIGCRILGREIGASLVTLIKKTKTEDLDELISKLDKLRQREITKALANFNDSAVQSIEDKYDCLNLFISASDSVADCIRRIETLFDDKKRGLLTLATVHKSKGLEWETVFILDRGLMPSRFAKTPSAKQQETNLQYVATTRAKLNLIYINSGNWKKEKIKECEDSPTGKHIFTSDLEYDSTGSTINCSYCGQLPNQL